MQLKRKFVNFKIYQKKRSNAQKEKMMKDTLNRVTNPNIHVNNIHIKKLHGRHRNNV